MSEEIDIAQRKHSKVSVQEMRTDIRTSAGERRLVCHTSGPKHQYNGTYIRHEMQWYRSHFNLHEMSFEGRRGVIGATVARWDHDATGGN
jgi:hypothetical protein